MKTFYVESVVHNNEKRIIEFCNYMRTLRYARQTIRTYESCLIKFFRFHHNRLPEEIDHQDIIDFNHEFIINNRLSFSYQNQLINALKGFYRMVYNRNLDMEDIERQGGVDHCQRYYPSKTFGKSSVQLKTQSTGQ